MKIQAEKTFISDEIMNYILDIIDETRNSADFRLGASPRASIALVKASKAFAFVNGREFVTPDDVKSLAVNILSHRLILSPKGKAAYNTNEQAVEAILEKIKVPTTRN
ncbi:MAG: magnesium chelatase, partial [Oscillospiraceae bacterium]|nr:magnesium chelatase [Oscillospiraceae bacterium]